VGELDPGTYQWRMTCRNHLGAVTSSPATFTVDLPTGLSCPFNPASAYAERLGLAGVDVSAWGLTCVADPTAAAEAEPEDLLGRNERAMIDLLHLWVSQEGLPAAAAQSIVDRFGRVERVGSFSGSVYEVGPRVGDDELFVTRAALESLAAYHSSGFIDASVWPSAWRFGTQLEFFARDFMKPGPDANVPDLPSNPGPGSWGMLNWSTDRTNPTAWYAEVGHPECNAAGNGQVSNGYDLFIDEYFAAQAPYEKYAPVYWMGPYPGYVSSVQQDPRWIQDLLDYHWNIYIDVVDHSRDLVPAPQIIQYKYVHLVPADANGDDFHARDEMPWRVGDIVQPGDLLGYIHAERLSELDLTVVALNYTDGVHEVPMTCIGPGCVNVYEDWFFAEVFLPPFGLIDWRYHRPLPDGSTSYAAFRPCVRDIQAPD
jgi:hypothetical protein